MLPNDGADDSVVWWNLLSGKKHERKRGHFFLMHEIGVALSHTCDHLLFVSLCLLPLLPRTVSASVHCPSSVMSDCVTVRPPRWEQDAPSSKRAKKNPTRKKINAWNARDVTALKKKQLATLEMFQSHASSQQWGKLHSQHFDWWMFPIDDGSDPQYNVRSECDIQLLLADEEWRERYEKSIAFATLYVYAFCTDWSLSLFPSAHILFRRCLVSDHDHDRVSRSS